MWVGSGVAPRRGGQPQDEAPALAVFEGGAIKHNNVISETTSLTAD
jgi:hypothetical protein